MACRRSANDDPRRLPAFGVNEERDQTTDRIVRSTLIAGLADGVVAGPVVAAHDAACSGRRGRGRPALSRPFQTHEVAVAVATAHCAR